MTLIDAIWVFFLIFILYHTVHPCKQQFMMQLCGIQCCFIFVIEIFDPAEAAGWDAEFSVVRTSPITILDGGDENAYDLNKIIV